MPFTNEQFFDVVAAYNTALWPAAAALWLLSLAVVGQLVRQGGADRHVTALLVVHWMWSAIAYHGGFFTRINPAAWLFAGLFGVQALLFAWVGRHHRLRFTVSRSGRHLVAAAFVSYALAYPFINLVLGEYPRVPTFGLPCPTTILTVGLLLAAEPIPWTLVVVPVLWSFIGGSAVILFGVTADLVLPVSGAALLAATNWRSLQPAVRYRVVLRNGHTTRTRR